MILVTYKSSKQNKTSHRKTPKFRNPSFSPFPLPKASIIYVVARMHLTHRRMPEARIQLLGEGGEEGRPSDILHGIYLPMPRNYFFLVLLFLLVLLSVYSLSFLASISLLS